MKFLKDKIRSKYTPKRTKLHHFKKKFPNPPSKAHGFALRSMSLRDMQISKSEKKFLGPPCQILATLHAGGCLLAANTISPTRERTDGL